MIHASVFCRVAPLASEKSYDLYYSGYESKTTQIEFNGWSEIAEMNK